MATPDAFKAAVPSGVAPSLNVTVPLGVPETAGLTIAVKVTEPPEYDGLALDARVVEVFCWTVCVRTEDVLVRLLLSPP